MNSYETKDSAIFLFTFFLLMFQDSLFEAEIGRQEACVLLSISKPFYDEEQQTIDSGARDNTKKFIA